jgi:hypothetical protein
MITVGAALIGGENGLVALLCGEGYEVERVAGRGEGRQGLRRGNLGMAERQQARQIKICRFLYILLAGGNPAAIGAAPKSL